MKICSQLVVICILTFLCFFACKRQKCADRKQNNKEVGVDCGGICPECGPEVITLPATSIMAVSAYISMKFSLNTGLSGSNRKVTSKGICYSTQTEPTLNNQSSGYQGSFGTYGDFSTQITGLLPNTTYYCRGYVKTDLGAAYGNEITFKTASFSNGISIITKPITSITSSTALSGGTITTTNGISITSRGICFNTNVNPLITNNIVTNGSGTGSFTSNLSNLTPNTSYYLRAYATTSLGTFYGNEIFFTSSSSSASLATVYTSVNITSPTMVQVICNVTNQGGANVFNKGICYSNSPSPTTSNTIIAMGSGLGSFASSITNLIPGTKYYFRAYATNSIGTAYGNQVTCTLFYIGQSYNGGKIAYIDNTGLHGLIAATSDQTTSIVWWNGTNTNTGANNTGLGFGQSNTNSIISSQGNTGAYAAKICQDLILSGYSDWYLPSLIELSWLFSNRTAIGNFTSNPYWSSSEASINTANGLSFVNGNSGAYLKNSSLRVRAIRSF
jgi:hypothetical protein